MHATSSSDTILYHPLPYRLIVLTITVLSMQLPKISIILTNSVSCKHYPESEAHRKKSTSMYNTLEVLVQALLRLDLHNRLKLISRL